MTEALTDTRVVTLNGARQAGKSTLARIAARGHPNALVRLLDDPATLRAAQDDPAGFVEHDGLLVIDEIQLAPELFRSIKVAVDTDQRPGQFLLTGSAQVLALRELPDALPGRPQPVMWYRGGYATDGAGNWQPCKDQSIARSRFDRYEIYSPFERHWITAIDLARLRLRPPSCVVRQA